MLILLLQYHRKQETLLIFLLVKKDPSKRIYSSSTLGYRHAAGLLARADKLKDGEEM